MKKEVLIIGSVLLVVVTITVCSNAMIQNQKKIIENQNVMINHMAQTAIKHKVTAQINERIWTGRRRMGFDLAVPA